MNSVKLLGAQSLSLGRRSLSARLAVDYCRLTLGFAVGSAILVFFGSYIWAELNARGTVWQMLKEIELEVLVVESREANMLCGRLDQPPLPITFPRGAPIALGNWKKQIAFLQCENKRENKIGWHGIQGKISSSDDWEKLKELAPQYNSTATPNERRVGSQVWPFHYFFSPNVTIEWVKHTDFGSMWRGVYTFSLKPKSGNEEAQFITVSVFSLGDRIRVNIWELWTITFLPLVGGIILAGGAILYAARHRIRSLTRVCSEIDELRDQKRGELSRASGDPHEITHIVTLFNEYLRTQKNRQLTQENRQREQLENLEQILDDVRNGERASRHAMGRMLDGLVGGSDAGTDGGTAGRLRQLKDILSRQLDIGSIRSRCSQLQTATDATRAEFVQGFENMLKKRNIKFELVCRPSETELRVWVDKIDLKEMLACLVYNAEAHSGEGVTKVQVIMEHAGDKVRLSVEDDGKGFPRDRYKRRRLTSWLCKGEGSNGSGIGLAYVFDAAAACGGKLQLGTSEILGGARATIELPLRKPSFGAD